MRAFLVLPHHKSGSTTRSGVLVQERDGGALPPRVLARRAMEAGCDTHLSAHAGRVASTTPGPSQPAPAGQAQNPRRDPRLSGPPPSQDAAGPMLRGAPPSYRWSDKVRAQQPQAKLFRVGRPREARGVPSLILATQGRRIQRSEGGLCLRLAWSASCTWAAHQPPDPPAPPPSFTQWAEYSQITSERPALPTRRFYQLSLPSARPSGPAHRQAVVSPWLACGGSTVFCWRAANLQLPRPCQEQG